MASFDCVDRLKPGLSSLGQAARLAEEERNANPQTLTRAYVCAATAQHTGSEFGGSNMCGLGLIC